jgi:hypothetical protein
VAGNDESAGRTPAAYREHRNLREASAFSFAEREHTDLGEMLGQQPRARAQQPPRQDQRQHAFHFEPAKGVLQETSLEALIAALAGFIVIGRIQIKQREAFGGAAHFEGRAMHELQPSRPGLLGAAGIEFNAVNTRGLAFQQMHEGGAVSRAGIERGKRIRAIEACAETLRLTRR